MLRVSSRSRQADAAACRPMVVISQGTAHASTGTAPEATPSPSPSPSGSSDVA
jgi:hypothetical protein